MNRVEVLFNNSAKDEPAPKWGKRLSGFTRKVLVELGRDKWDVSVFLCDDAAITELNRKYRKKTEATDILSFSMEEGEMFFGDNHASGRSRRLPGDIAISLDTLRKNAQRFGVSEDEELRRLLIHGILHLDGMDHKSNGEKEPMLQLQERILASLEKEHIMPKSLRGGPSAGGGK